MQWTERSGDVASWGERLTRISAEMMDVKRVVLAVVDGGNETSDGLTFTGAHVSAGLEENGCLLVRADNTLLNLHGGKPARLLS